MALAIRPGTSSTGDDLAIASVIRLRPGVFSDAWFQTWRADYDESACEVAGGVKGSPAQVSIAGRTVYVGTCAGDARTYHVHLADPTLIVSITAAGARALRRARGGRPRESSLGAMPLTGARPVRAPRGTQLSCRGWEQEAALRMLMNNLDPEVAEDPDNLVVYGGTGRAARSWAAFDAIVRELRGAGGGRDVAGPVRQAGRRRPDASRGRRAC